MTIKQVILYTMLALSSLFKAQTITKNLLKANAYQYRNTIYVYGYDQQKSNLVFKCFAFDHSLHMKDSVDFSLGNYVVSNFLDISIDSLHHFINIYFQLANEKNKVTLLRLNDTLGKVCIAKDYDANHINSMIVFNDEKYNYNNDLYVIKTNKDSMGIQFYLNKYHVKSILKPFEYIDKWQFAFDHQFIHQAHLIYVDSAIVMVYVNVIDGLKKGQWILRINAVTGKIIKGTRLSQKLDSKNYLYSNSIYDTKTKRIAIIGSVYESGMIDFLKNTSSFTNLSKRHQLFITTIDSIGEVISKAEKLIVLPLQTNNSTSTNSYHLKIREFKITVNGFDVWADIYNQALPNTFVYYSSWHIDILGNEVGYNIVPSKLLIATSAIPKFISYVKGDNYGKFALNNISDYDQFKYKSLLNKVVIKTDLDNLGNSFFILKKTDIMLGTTNYHHVFLSKKGLEYKTVLKCERGQKGVLFFTKQPEYISFTTNTENTNFVIKLNIL